MRNPGLKIPGDFSDVLGASDDWVFNFNTEPPAASPSLQAAPAAPPDDYAGDTTTTGTVSVGGTATGNVEVANDTDWFRVTLTAGTSYRVDLNGSAGGGGTLSDPFVFIYNSSGTIVASDNSSGVGSDSRTFYTANGTGTYYISARASGPVTGTYTVHLTLDDRAADLNNVDQLGTLSFNTVFIETAGDHDWFTTNLVDGHNYVIRNTTSTGVGALTDPNIAIRNSGGNVLFSDDDHGIGLGSELAVHANGGGTYYVDAGAFGSATGYSSLILQDLGAGSATSHFQSPAGIAYAGFGASAGGWSSQEQFPRFLGNANGDDTQDIYGFGGAGVYIANNAHNESNTFNSATLALNAFGAAGGWDSQDHYPRFIAQEGGNSGFSDIVGFGGAGVYVALGNGNDTFAAASLTLPGQFGAAGGWTSQDHYPRILGDVNKDGLDDIVGFGGAGTYVALSTGNGNFGSPIFSAGIFGEAGGWSSQDAFPRALADVNGDGYRDIVGFGNAGAYVALSTHDGHFNTPFLATSQFGADTGWSNQNAYPRLLADVNGDGRTDIVGFGGASVYIATANVDGTFNAAVADTQSFSAAAGWNNLNLYPRMLAEVTGDTTPDIVAFGANGVYVAQDFNFHIV